MPDLDLATLHARRLEAWRQTPDTHITGPDKAIPLIERLGFVTLYPVSPELPNLYHAYVGDSTQPTDSKWDSPAGQVYGWRWTLGRQKVAFYTALVKKRSTWVSWALLPAVLRLWGELRMPDELYDNRLLTPEAYRIAKALDDAGHPLSTGELRVRAGFPTGKEQRTAYLKAVEELETRLLLAKVFEEDKEDAYHTLVADRYREHVDAAERLTRESALDAFLAAYLPAAAYALPTPLAKHLKLPDAELSAALDRLVAAGHAERAAFDGVKGVSYVWVD
ncbi:MAG: AlkZ-related protein [Ktedonobacterales bacterium]